MTKEAQLIAELEWIKNIAQKIDDENHSLQDKLNKVKAQYSTQENDREILLREVILKKKKNAILKSQIDQYEKILNEVSKDNDAQNSLLEEMGHDHSRMGKSIDMHTNNNNRANSPADGNHSRMSNMKVSGGNSLQIPRGSLQVDNSMVVVNQRAENTINTLKSLLTREKKKVQQLKILYIKELEGKSIFEQILRKCIEDIKDDILAVQKDRLNKKGSKFEYLDKAERATLIEKLINDERILTLIYDKTFYGSSKKIEIPPELLMDDDDDELRNL